VSVDTGADSYAYSCTFVAKTVFNLFSLAFSASPIPMRAGLCGEKL
jgi:hypothetical protein